MPLVYIAMSDLLREFDDPAVMDIKMGVRTYLEDELKNGNSKLRPVSRQADRQRNSKHNVLTEVCVAEK